MTRQSYSVSKELMVNIARNLLNYSSFLKIAAKQKISSENRAVLDRETVDLYDTLDRLEDLINEQTS